MYEVTEIYRAPLPLKWPIVKVSVIGHSRAVTVLKSRAEDKFDQIMKIFGIRYLQT
jgi:hypothetical protein